MQLEECDYAPLVAAALAEDLGTGDLTTECTVPAGLCLEARVIARSDGVLAGRPVAEHVFRCLAADCSIEGARDGARMRPGDEALRLRGPARALLSGERVALNFLQRLSGIATLTSRCVEAVAGTGVAISDTRKTTPGWRRLEKYAVRCGGGVNHRLSLDAMLLVKENHIAAAGSLATALAAASAVGRARGLEVEVEVRSLEELDSALRFGPQRILLDHWSPEQVREAVRRRGPEGRPELEVSGNLTLESLRAYALPGVAVLSVGALTHSAPALDLSMLFEGVAG